MKEKKKPYKVGATYELRPEYVERLWFTASATEYCKRLYGVERHVFRAKCVGVNDSGGATFNLTTGDFYAASYERHMFRRVDNK